MQFRSYLNQTAVSRCLGGFDQSVCAWRRIVSSYDRTFSVKHSCQLRQKLELTSSLLRLVSTWLDTCSEMIVSSALAL